MTRAELTTAIDVLLRNKTADGSITGADESDAIETVADYVDSLINKGKALFKVAQSGTSDPTFTSILNKTGLTFTASRTSSGNYNVTPSTSLSGEVKIVLHFNGSSFAIPSYEVDNLGVLFTLSVKYWNGSNFVAADGVINGAYLEIEILG